MGGYEVTVGIPVYNVEKYIAMTMDSALAQTFQSIEFLICDDCGTDGSIAVIQELQQTHPRGRDIRVPYPLKVFTEEDIFADYVYHIGIQGMNWNYLIDMNIIRRNGLKVTEVGHGYGEDFTFTIDLPTYITRAVLLPDITYHYYNRDVSKPKKKKVLSREYLTRAIDAIAEKKRRSELLAKRYYSKRISILMMLDCSFACEMVGRRDEFDEPFSNREVRDMMWHPMTFWQIITAKSGRFHNLLYWTFGVVPPFLCAWLLKPMIKRYGVSRRR